MGAALEGRHQRAMLEQQARRMSDTECARHMQQRSDSCWPAAAPVGKSPHDRAGPGGPGLGVDGRGRGSSTNVRVRATPGSASPSPYPPPLEHPQKGDPLAAPAPRRSTPFQDHSLDWKMLRRQGLLTGQGTNVIESARNIRGPLAPVLRSREPTEQQNYQTKPIPYNALYFSHLRKCGGLIASLDLSW